MKYQHVMESEFAAWNKRAATTIGKVQVEIEPALRGMLTAEEMKLDNERFVVCAVAPGRVHRWDIHNIGELDRGTVAYPPDSLHHFKQRTIEDVLQCAGVSVAAIEDVAAEIRELMEAGE